MHIRSCDGRILVDQPAENVAVNESSDRFGQPWGALQSIGRGRDRVRDVSVRC